MTRLKIDLQQHLREYESSFTISWQYAVLGILTVLVLSIRLGTIHIPSLEWTAWKEIDYLYISQHYAEGGFDFLRPEVGWPAEPPRVTEMEFPLVPFVAAVFYKLFGFNVYTVRITTLLAFMLMMLFVFKLTKRELGDFAGLIAALAAGVLPLYHPFGKFLFTEPLMIAMSVVSLFYFAEWTDFRRRKDWILAIISLSLTIALKIETLYLFLPISWIMFRKYRFQLKEYKGPVLMIALSLILPVLWYTYAYYLENTGAHVFGIFRGHDKFQTFTMLSDWRWYLSMANRVIFHILGGPYGTLLFLIGLAAAAWLRKGGLFFFYLASIGAYFAIVAEGNIDAPYRQLTLVPVASVFIAFGVQAAISTIFGKIKGNFTITKYASGMALLSGLVLVTIIPVLRHERIFTKDGPSDPQRWEIAQEIRRFADSRAKLVVLGEYTKHVGGYDLSPVLYYYSGFQGWTLTPANWNLEKIGDLRKKGATFLVAFISYGNEERDLIHQPEESMVEFIGELKSHFPVLSENRNQIIFDLSRKKNDR